MKKLLLSIWCLCTCLLAMAVPNANEVIIPRPASVVVTNGSYLLKTSATISQKGAKDVERYFINQVQNDFDVQLKSVSKKANITIEVDKTANIAPEGYTLNISLKGINILASTDAGAFYGVQSLLQLMKAGNNGKSFEIACQEIVDAPRFAWRAYMLDESRYFKGEEEVYSMLDEMAKLKMNVFHWHLTDDAGWRLESKKYPLLTEIGGKRKDTQIGGWKSEQRMGKPHEGFYTQEQVKRILAYAKERQIKVVPEIEMPGHACAAIAAYPWLGTKNEVIEVPAEFGKHYHTFNVIDPKVKAFLKDVIAEVIELFDTDVIHIGGDEVRFNHWEEDANMVAYKEAKGFNSFMDIQIEFTNEMSQYIADKGCSMMGWNEILGTNLHADDNIQFAETTTQVAPNVVVQFWKGNLNELKEAAEKGYKLVNSFHSMTYLDYGNKNINLQKAYSFNPIPEGLPKEYEKNIIGSGCQMWSEWTPTVQDVQKQTFPKIAAYAEIGWTELDNKDFDSFLVRLKPLAKEWKESGLNIYEFEELQ